MKIKDINTIWITTETGNTFGYVFHFEGDTLTGGHLIGSHGDIFPIDLEECAPFNIKPNDEITREYMQRFFNTTVCEIRLDIQRDNKWEKVKV